MHEREPTLDELLNEPMIRKVMVADGYSAEDVRLLMGSAKARSNAKGFRYLMGSAGAHGLRGSDTSSLPR